MTSSVLPNDIWRHMLSNWAGIRVINMLKATSKEFGFVFECVTTLPPFHFPASRRIIAFTPGLRFPNLQHLTMNLRDCRVRLSALLALSRLRSLTIILETPLSWIEGLEEGLPFRELESFKLIRHAMHLRLSKTDFAIRSEVLWASLSSLPKLQELDLSALLLSTMTDVEFAKNVTRLTTLTSIQCVNSTNPRLLVERIGTKLPNLRYLRVPAHTFGNTTEGAIVGRETPQKRAELGGFWRRIQPPPGRLAPMLYSNSRILPSFLMGAARNSCVWAGQFFLDERLSDVNERNPRSGRTALAVACHSADTTQFLEMMIARGANLNTTTVDYRLKGRREVFTPLCYLAYSNRSVVGATELLIENGADINLSSIHPVAVALYSGHVYVLQYYLEAHPGCRQIACDAYVDLVRSGQFRTGVHPRRSGSLFQLLQHAFNELSDAFSRTDLSLAKHVATYPSHPLLKLFGILTESSSGELAAPSTEGVTK